MSIAIGQRITRAEYIEKYKDLAIKNMRDHKIPASITLAQGLLESDDGNSLLASKYNNHFGIKCHSSWSGKRTYKDDDTQKECFRVYPSVQDSYDDHSVFLHKPRYAKCFELEITDYKNWALELKKAGYATNPKYPQLLVDIIEENELYRYDKEALGESKPAKTGKEDPASNEFDDIDYYNKPIVRQSKNNIKYIEASEGDTPKKIADKLDMGPWQIRKYNDVDKNYRFSSGDIVYLQPKRNKAAANFHEVKTGETIWDISQQYGIKIKSIYKLNDLPKNSPLVPGQKLKLRKNPLKH